jgi:acyl carrier protein
MTKEDKLQRLPDIFREVLDDPDLRLTENFSMEDCPAWDSVVTVQIVLAMESAFGVPVPIETVANLRRAGELLALLP